MSTHTDKKRKSLMTIVSLWRPTHHATGKNARADYLHAIQEDVVVTSPKVYESGMITNLDLRLVDLYGDDANESRHTTSDAPLHELRY
jgi:hypothetical protein